MLGDFKVSPAQRKERRRLLATVFASGFRYQPGDEWPGCLTQTERDAILRRAFPRRKGRE